MKSAVRHILSVDRRDDRILPTTGSFLKFTSELSGFKIIQYFFIKISYEKLFKINNILKTIQYHIRLKLIIIIKLNYSHR